MGQFQLLNSDRKESYGLLYQNIRSLITRNSKKKIDYLKEYTQEYEQKKNITQINVDHIPWKIIMQNTEGLATENSKVGIETMREYANDEKILAMNFTETWYNETIKEEANIEGYNIFRCDRK